MDCDVVWSEVYKVSIGEGRAFDDWHLRPLTTKFTDVVSSQEKKKTIICLHFKKKITILYFHVKI